MDKPTTEEEEVLTPVAAQRSSEPPHSYDSTLGVTEQSVSVSLLAGSSLAPDRPARGSGPPPVHQEHRPAWVGNYAGLPDWLIVTAGDSPQDCLRTLLLAGVSLGRCVILPRWCYPERRTAWMIADIVRDGEGYPLPLYVVWASSYPRGGRCWVEVATAHGQAAADEAVRRLKADPWWQQVVWLPVGRHPGEASC